MAGNGSDELLSILMRCYVEDEDRVAYPVPTYSLYETLIAIQGGQSLMIPYPDDFAIPAPLYFQSSKVTILCNPNAPSGTLERVSEIARLARSVAGLLIVDEAYIDFADTDESAIALVNRFPNLVVLRTFSKAFSLAGMRVGLAFGSEGHRAQPAQGQGLLQPVPSQPRRGSGGAGGRGVDAAERRADSAHPQDADPGPAQAGLRGTSVPGQLRDGKAGQRQHPLAARGAQGQGHPGALLRHPRASEHDAGHGGQTAGDPGRYSRKRKPFSRAAA